MSVLPERKLGRGAHPCGAFGATTPGAGLDPLSDLGSTVPSMDGTGYPTVRRPDGTTVETAPTHCPNGHELRYLLTGEIGRRTDRAITRRHTSADRTLLPPVRAPGTTPQV